MLLEKLNIELVKKALCFAVILLALFFFVYECLLKGLPSVFSSRKIIFVILLIVYSVKGKIALSAKFFFPFFILLTGFVTIITFSFFASDLATPIYPKLFFFFLFAFCAPHFFSKFFDHVENFLVAFTLCGAIQSLIVFFQFFSFPFRQFLDSNFVKQGNIEFLRVSRATGLGCEGATLGFWISISMIACAYLIVRKKTKIFFIPFVLMMTAEFFIARTGLIISIILFIFMIICLSKKSLITAGCVIIFSVVSLFFVSSVLTQNIDVDRLDYIQTWQSSVFETNKGSSLYSLQKMQIPELSLELMVGTGVARGDFAFRNESAQHDSGYIQSYIGLGLFVAVIFYLVVYFFLFFEIKKINNTLLKSWLFLLFALIIVNEMKEPFVLKYIPFFFIYTISLIDRKEREISLCTTP